MTAAAISAFTIPVASSTQVRDLLDGEGRIEIFGETWCLSFEHGSKRVRDNEGCDYVFASGAIVQFEDVRLPTNSVVHEASGVLSADAT